MRGRGLGEWVMTMDFLERFNGRSQGVLQWEHLDALWERIRESADGWYVYAVGETPPQELVSAERLRQFISEVDALLRREHEESYCGIVYVDDPLQPALVKIFDPNHLGASCGSSGLRILPGWVLSRVPPADLHAITPPTNSRRRWWQRIWRD